MTKHFININEIHVAANRQRREFDQEKLNELRESVQSIGLLHPIVLRFDGEGYILVAGERRLRAIKDLYELGGVFSYAGEPVISPLIPYTPMGELTPLETMEAEYEENIRRSDITWQEKAAATAKLLELRQAQAAETGGAEPTVADIALEVRGDSRGVHHQATRRELIIANHLSDPVVKAAKSLEDAFKLLKRKEIVRKNEEAATTFGAIHESAFCKIFNQDSLVWLAEAQPNQFDVILTDPPYGMSAEDFGDSGKVDIGAHHYKDTLEHALHCYGVLAHEGFRITKPDAHLYTFCDIDVFPLLKEIFSVAGWQVFRTPIIWFKPSAYRMPWVNKGPRRNYETILYAIKGNLPTTRVAGDVITCQPDENLGHRAQKPYDLLKDLLSRSVSPGMKVLDPFCGSGTIFPVASSLKCFITGIEIDPIFYGLSCRRIAALQEAA